MAVDAYLAEPFVFQKLFVDDTGAPISVIGSNITIIRFNGSNGNEIPLVTGAPMSPAFPPDPGRYVFVFTIPGTLLDGDVLYAEVRAVDPSTSFVIVSTETINVKSRSNSSTGCGLNARFVR